jgi:hypothetical protein
MIDAIDSVADPTAVTGSVPAPEDAQ